MSLDVHLGHKTLDYSQEGIDISDANALVAEVMAGRTFYSVAPPRKTGTMPTVAIVAANDNYPAGYHVGNVGGLDAIDADLAPANIKSGKTIFGKLGTYAGANPDHDNQGAQCDIGTTTTAPVYYDSWSVAAGGDQTIVTDTIAVVVGACLEAFGTTLCHAGGIDVLKVRLFVDGVQKGESGFILATAPRSLVCLMGYTENFAAGNKIVMLQAHNYDGAAKTFYMYAGSVFGGSVKVGA